MRESVRLLAAPKSYFGSQHIRSAVRERRGCGSAGLMAHQVAKAKLTNIISSSCAFNLLANAAFLRSSFSRRSTRCSTHHSLAHSLLAFHYFPPDEVTQFPFPSASAHLLSERASACLSGMHVEINSARNCSVSGRTEWLANKRSQSNGKKRSERKRFSV